MSKPTKWWIVIFISIVLMAGAYFYWKDNIARPPVIVIGGPCSYDTTKLPAKITDILIGSNDLVYIKVEMKTRDSVVHVFDLNRKFRQTFGKNDWIQSGIKEGDTMTCLNYTINSGNCSPEIFVFMLKKYPQ